MSRGLGAVQRFVLYMLEDGEWWLASDLAAQRAAALSGAPLQRRPTRSEVESVRRAIRELAAAGFVEAEDHEEVPLWRRADLEKLTPQKRIDADIFGRVPFSRRYLCARLPRPDEDA